MRIGCAVSLAFIAIACGRQEPEIPAGPAPLPVPTDAALRIAIAPPGVAVSPIDPFESVHLPLWLYTYPALLRVEAGQDERFDLARRAEWSEDPLEEHGPLSFVAHLDPSRTWSDGTAISSFDVKASFDVMAARQLLPSGAKGARVLAHIETPDESTVRLVFAPHTPRWLARQIAALPILSPAERQTKESGQAGPSGGGLFQIESREAGRRVVLVPSQKLPPALSPRVPEVVLEVCPGADSRALRVALGGADIALDVSLHHLESVLGESEPVTRSAGVTAVEMLIWNSLLVPDAELRHAAGIAIDRTALTNLVRYRDHVYGRAGRGFLPDLYTQMEPYPFEPAAAESTGATRFWEPIRILYDGHDVFHGELMARIESDLARAGMRVEATPLAREDLLNRFSSGLFDCVLLGFRPPEHLDTSALWASWGRWNGASYFNARVDSLCGALYHGPFEAEGRSIALAIEQQLRADEAVTFLLERERVDLVGPRVAGWTGTVWNPLGRLEEVRLAAPADPVAARPGE